MALAARALADRVEAEDAAGAEALLLGALARGWGRAELEPIFFELCAAHFLSFGHRLIHQCKGWDLLEAAGALRPIPPEQVADVLTGHLYGIVSGTREDVLPAWAGFRKRLHALDLPALYAALGEGPAPGLEAALVAGSPAEAFDAVTTALTTGASLQAVVNALSLAAAERMLRFNVAIDGDPSVQDNWLSVTHIQTFANEVRVAATRWPHPAVLRLVYFAARMIQHHAVLDGERPSLEPADGDLFGAIAARDAAAPGIAARALGEGLDLLGPLLAVPFSDALSRPIVVAHALKNLVTADAEVRARGDLRPMLALVRLFASPIQQRWAHRSALEAIDSVTDGKIPRLLAP